MVLLLLLASCTQADGRSTEIYQEIQDNDLSHHAVQRLNDTYVG